MRLSRVIGSMLLLVSAAGVVGTAGPASAAGSPGTCTISAVVAIKKTDNSLNRWVDPTAGTAGGFSAATVAGTSWSSARLLAADSTTGDLFAVFNDGVMRRYQLNGTSYQAMGQVGTGWGSAVALLPQGERVIFAVFSDGTMKWYGWSDTGWRTGSGTQIGNGWGSFGPLASGGKGVVYAVNKATGRLHWYKRGQFGLPFGGSWTSPTVVSASPGWKDFTSLVGAGDGILYGMKSTGELYWYNHIGAQTGSASWGTGSSSQIGSGWQNYRAATAAPNGCLPEPGAAAPPRDNSQNEPIYFVHGFNFGVTAPESDCYDYFNDAVTGFRNLGWNAPMHTIAFYAGDTNCTTRIANGDRGTSIEELGRQLAWNIYSNYSKYGVSVDIVAHSMGGLVARAAVTGTARGLLDWPPYVYVEDGITIGTPHHGTSLANACTPLQCVQLRPGSALQGWLYQNAQAAGGTDWTYIGTEDDDVVPVASATIEGGAAGHYVWYYVGQVNKEHGQQTHDVTSSNRNQYWNYYDGIWRQQTAGASIITTAKNAAHYWRDW